MHHHTIQIIQPTRCNSFTSLLFDIYVWLNMFRASPHPSSGAYNCTRSLWFYRWREAAGALLVVVARCSSFTSLILDVYVWLSMFRASPRPSSGAYNCTRSLWFYRWREAAGALLVVVARCNSFTSLTFMYGSTCFGRLPAHHQEHATALGASGAVGEKRLER